VPYFDVPFYFFPFFFESKKNQKIKKWQKEAQNNNVPYFDVSFSVKEPYN